MKIFGKFQIIDNFPALYIKSLKALIISDLHLGIEELYSHSGFLIPKFQLREIIHDLKEMLGKTKARRIIINGDIKHEFSEFTWSELKEIREFLNFLSSKLEEILLVKGNHDNYVIYALKKYANIKLEDYFLIEDMCFIHGHQKNLDLRQFGAKFFIIGNEHPVVVMRDEFGTKEKVPCFLYGDLEGKKIIVMPAFTKVFSGAGVNEMTSEEFLSPMLKNKEIDNFEVTGISKEVGILKFPKLGKLREIHLT